MSSSMNEGFEHCTTVLSREMQGSLHIAPRISVSSRGPANFAAQVTVQEDAQQVPDRQIDGDFTWGFPVDRGTSHETGWFGGSPRFRKLPYMCGGWVQPETQSTGLRRGRMCYQLWFRFVRRLQEKHPFKVKEHIRTWSLPNFPINTYLARFLPIIHLSSHKATKISIAPDPPEATQQAGLLSCRVRSQTRELIARRAHWTLATCFRTSGSSCMTLTEKSTGCNWTSVERWCSKEKPWTKPWRSLDTLESTFQEHRKHCQMAGGWLFQRWTRSHVSNFSGKYFTRSHGPSYTEKPYWDPSKLSEGTAATDQLWTVGERQHLQLSCRNMNFANSSR